MNNNFKQNKCLQDTRFICGIAILINFVISYFILLNQQPFNVDGILYLNSAKAFLSDGLKGAMAVYPWPFYSILIAGLAKLTHLPFDTSAFILNALLTAILVAAFILLVKEIGGSTKEQYFGLLIILLYPYLNHDRDNILRDFGYYAFLLVSLLFFIRYLRELKWRYAMSWCICTIIAILFRIEGAIILALVPLVVFLKPNVTFAQKLLAFFKAYSLNIIIFVGFWGFVLSKPQQDTADLGRLSELITHIHSGLAFVISNLNLKQTALEHYVLSPMGRESAFVFLLGGLTAIFIDTFVYVLGWFYLALMLYALVGKLIPKSTESRLALYSYVIIIIITLIAFLSQQFFLAYRYMTPLCLILMLSIPFAATKIFSQKNWVSVLIGFLFLLTAISSFVHFGTSKSYIVDAGVWIKQNTQPQDRLYSNSAQVAYYSDRAGTHYPEDFVQDNKSLFEHVNMINLKQYDYLALLIYHDEMVAEKQMLDFIKSKPIIIFNNNRGDKVLVFKLKN